IIAAAIFSIFTLAIPHAWAKYAGEKILARTYGLQMVLVCVTSPVLFVFRLYDGLVRRLAGVTETKTEEKQEEKAEEAAAGLGALFG
ncbi:MAG: hypothetical protein KAS32_03730, partial [Candidatus Peribacteraceae bacterium]|nr:hypothetical protein [Candidatus Peribacteraceae bacterium]